MSTCWARQVICMLLSYSHDFLYFISLWMWTTQMFQVSLSASSNKLATITLLVNPPFSFGTAFVTFVSLFVAFPGSISGPLTLCFTFSWTDVLCLIEGRDFSKVNLEMPQGQQGSLPSANQGNGCDIKWSTYGYWDVWIQITDKFNSILSAEFRGDASAFACGSNVTPVTSPQLEYLR